MIKIQNTSNGIIVTYNDGDKVIYKVNSEDGFDDLLECLYDILEDMGYCSGRYAAERIQIKIIHGDKYECNQRKTCKICGEV